MLALLVGSRLVERTRGTFMWTIKFWVSRRETPRRTERERESEKCMTDGGREMEENGRVLVFVGCRTNDKLDSATVPKSPFLTLS